MNAALPAPPPGYTGYISEEHHHDYAGDTVFGFWIYILSDCVLFATLFAVFAVLQHNFAGSIEASELFDLVLLGDDVLTIAPHAVDQVHAQQGRHQVDQADTGLSNRMIGHMYNMG